MSVKAPSAKALAVAYREEEDAEVGWGIWGSPPRLLEVKTERDGI